MHHLKPTITAQSGKKRMGKGFSPQEIKQAGLTSIDARKLKVSIDRKRKTTHEDNVNTLKINWEKFKTTAKPKPLPVVENIAAKNKRKPKN